MKVYDFAGCTKLPRRLENPDLKYTVPIFLWLDLKKIFLLFCLKLRRITTRCLCNIVWQKLCCTPWTDL